MDETASLFVLGSFVIACSAKVARFPQPGESLCAEAFTVETGGKGFNLALGAHRLGAAVDGLLAVGDDLFGQLAEPTLTEAGLPLDMIHRYRTTTGSGIGFTNANGENCLAVFSGANRLLSAEDVRAAAGLRRASLVLAQFEIGDEPIIEAFTLAHRTNCPTLLNPSPFRIPDPRILDHTTLLVVNAVEATQMAGALGLAPGSTVTDILVEDATRLGAALVGGGIETVIVTLGARGAVACRSGVEPIHQPAFAVEPVDSLGAGDAFTAGLAASLLDGRPLPECLKRAAACGALVARRLGVFRALPTADELERFLAEPR
ncbi:ribokinase [Azospirillum brasilense]|uniref:Ribokinase n=1 Tax=Azospirillum brasilense TaxID=192 RepID=A0A235HDL6_AZOBR|nr:ribokinase [Azospirillum brasilense]OYD83792.1 ribokinase [Azospirillum brasilense]